jgi:G3E family GTPase
MYQKLRRATKRRLCGRVVPVTILTGFLGSGKSTLVRHILTSPDHGRRIAVVENEFGGGGGGGGGGGDSLADLMGLSVETVIVRDGTSSSDGGGRRNLLADLIELPNGCVCCTVKDTLVVMLERLLETRTDIDYVLLESIFWLNGALDSRLRLDGIVCCVNACNIGYQLECTSSSHHSSFRAASS